MTPDINFWLQVAGLSCLYYLGCALMAEMISMLVEGKGE